MKPISWYKSLSLPKPRREEGCFLVDGKRSVGHILTYRPQSVSELLCIEDTAQSYQSYQSDIPVRVISEANMNAISPSRAPQGVCALVRIPDGVYTSEIPDVSISGIGINTDNNIHINNNSINANNTRGGKILLLEHIQDPGNVGTLIRTAAAFGFDGVIMSGLCADPFSPKAVQSTAGSLLSLWLRRSDGYLRMITELKTRGYSLIAADLRGDDFRDVPQHAAPNILALGNEGAGLSEDIINMSDYKVRIPISPPAAESLNVAVAGGILMFAWR
jgi:TrmH family RNA methyltransferase